MGCGSSTGGAVHLEQPERTTHTRVVWDIENVPVPAGRDAFEVVVALEQWLMAQLLWGSNVDGLISCFYNPASVPKSVRQALDRAGVEQVLAGAKREDADRTMCARLEREATVLPRDRTSFVLISSDCDFAPPLRRLVQGGFSPVVLCCARGGTSGHTLRVPAGRRVHPMPSPPRAWAVGLRDPAPGQARACVDAWRIGTARASPPRPRRAAPRRAAPRRARARVRARERERKRESSLFYFPLTSFLLPLDLFSTSP